MYACLEESEWAGWCRYLGGVVVAGDWTVVNGKYLMRVIAPVGNKLEEIKGYAQSRGKQIRLLTEPVGTRFAWGSEKTQVLVERGYAHPWELSVASGWPGKRLLIYLSDRVVESSQPEVVLSWEEISQGEREWQEARPSAPPANKVKLRLGWRQAEEKGRRQRESVGGYGAASVGRDRERWGWSDKDNDGEREERGARAGIEKRGRQWVTGAKRMESRVYVAAGLAVEGVGISTLARQVGLADNEKLLIYPEQGVTGLVVAEKELVPWIDRVQLQLKQKAESRGNWASSYPWQSLREIQAVSAVKAVRVRPQVNKGKPGGVHRVDEQRKYAGELGQQGQYLRAGEIWEELGDLPRALAEYNEVKVGAVEYVRARVRGVELPDATG